MKFDVKVWESEEGAPMAPMVDMVFLLLIFFMVASHLNQLEMVEIQVPEAVNASVPEALNDRRTITIKHDDSVYLGNRPSSVEAVKASVKKEREMIPGLKIYLRADKRVKHGRVREVMKACAEGGAAEIIFATYEAP